MTQPIRFCLVLHNHQPIGNFDGVFEQAYQDSYLPFLDVFEPYTDLRISLHTSGPLMEWLDEHHSEYLDRLAALVDAGRVEIIGGSFYEAILAMIPSRDRVGQISDYSRWLEQRLGATVQGMWVPERVWEQPMASDIADAGIKYTVLDDFHFKNAGLNEDELNGYFVTEDDGRTLNVFPGSERLRYLIPFGAPHETIDYLRGISERHPGAVVTFGDDGEKFGTWPDTKKHVYDNGWLRQFFEALVKNRDWINTTTLADAAKSTPPVGKIYLPDGSYREMTEWVLAADQQVEYENITHEMHDDPRWQRLVRFVRGGYWRNFKVKYPEANEMYSRMLQVSRRLAQAEAADGSSEELNWARRELYRGQCNCSYWHGAFGGIYLPHLRNAVYNHLIAADNLLDRAADKPTKWIEATADDFNFDGQQEIRLANDRVVAFLAPLTGGHLYELDIRSICHNLLATLTRRPEAYHRKVLAGANQDNSNVASIHDRVVFKQEGLDQRLQYDSYPRKSLVDHFYDDDTSLHAITSGDADERSDFRDGGFETKLRKGVDRVQVLMSRDGNAFGIPIKLTKGVTLNSGSNVLEIAYLLEHLPQNRTLHFSVEFNLAGLPSGADDRFFYRGDHNHRLGQLGTQLDLCDVNDLGLVDEWLGIDVHWSADRPTNVWTFPIETVSQSEGGFELVHQSVVVQPHWHVRGDANGRWAVTMRLSLDTSLAESRAAQVEVGAVLAH
jgi:alpha-amylase